MKNSKLLNKNFLSLILFYFILGFAVQSEEPIDIWNIEGKNTNKDVKIIENFGDKDNTQNSIYKMQSKKDDESNIEEDETLTSNSVKIVGLYDPAENGLDINMWSNSNGDQILNIFKRINTMDLSSDASEILDILLLTNAHYPKMNISKNQFLELKSNWLIKNSNFQLIENYLLKNQMINEHPKLAKLLVDDYLSRSEVKKACQIFSKIKSPIQDDYLSRFNIYCLINNDKKEEAQLLLDLKNELGFKNEFYEKKINYLMGYTKQPDTEISENTILEFHLSHRTNPQFKFEPKNSTSKLIWKYLSSSNLLDSINDIELTDIEKINSIERATHEKHYEEMELFELYKKFQFNINQLLNIRESTKVLSAIESRALIYQGILITTEIEKKLQLMNALKNSFKNEKIENAFDIELKNFLKNIDKEQVPSNFTTFYNNYVDQEKAQLTNIKINNKVLHQSKLLNYFKGKSSTKKTTKDLNDMLKKAKKNKKYFFSKKDTILIESLKSDGIQASEKFKDLYEMQEPEIPADIQIFINSGDLATAMLRIVEVIGREEIKDIDENTLHFIISTLNQLDVDPLRNKILLKVLPLKV